LLVGIDYPRRRLVFCDLLPTQTERLLGLRRDLILALAEAGKVRISVLRIPGRKREYWLVSLDDLVAYIESSVQSSSEMETGRVS
jgi:hypothetical protein